jgi:DNA repair protein RadC
LLTAVGVRPQTARSQDLELLADRLRCLGAGSLSDEELLGLVLGASAAGSLVARLKARAGPLHELGRASLGRLAVDGRLGLARAARLRAALELGRRAIDLPLERGRPIACADDVVALLRGRLVALDEEQLHVLGLDTQSRLVLHFVAAVGAVNLVYVSPREVLRPLVREGVGAAIVVHNHPSGAAEPSDADRQLTARLRDAGELVGIALIDHVVVARDGRYSFAERGALPSP